MKNSFTALAGNRKPIVQPVDNFSYTYSKNFTGNIYCIADLIYFGDCYYYLKLRVFGFLTALLSRVK